MGVAGGRAGHGPPVKGTGGVTFVGSSDTLVFTIPQTGGWGVLVYAEGGLHDMDRSQGLVRKGGMMNDSRC